MDVLQYPNSTIYFDSENITSSVSSLIIDEAISYIHHQVTFISSDVRLYDIFMEKYQRTQVINLHVEVRIGTTTNTYKFVVDSVQHSGNFLYTFSGRSITALLDTPYSPEVEYQVCTESKLASEVFAELRGMSPYSVNCEWHLLDWMIPSGWTATGTPLQCMQSLVQIIEGTLHSNTQGDVLLAENLFACFPTELSSLPITLRIDTDKVVLEYEETQENGANYSSIVVEGNIEGNTAPLIMVDPEFPVEIGKPAYVRVYWGGNTPVDTDFYATSGSCSSCGTYTEYVSEYVAFISGESAVERPITAINSIEWIGLHSKLVWEKNVQKLYLAYQDTDLPLPCKENDGTADDHSLFSKAYRVAKICYKSTYERFKISDLSVLELIFAISYYLPGVSIHYIIDGTDDNPAPPQSSAYLTSEAALCEYAKNILGKTSFSYKQITITLPITHFIHPKDIIFLNSSMVSIIGILHVDACSYELGDIPVVHVTARQWII